VRWLQPLLASGGAAALLVGALIASLLAPSRSVIAAVITLGPDC
jgi:hypothetical protein